MSLESEIWYGREIVEEVGCWMLEGTGVEENTWPKLFSLHSP